MGLMDSLFNPNTYGGQGGGLLDFLRQSQMQQEQYQPVQSPWPAQPGPVDVGGYQMPRVGNVAQFTPDPAAIPQNAQPAQGQMPMQAPQGQMQPAQTPEQGVGSFFGRIGNPDGLIARLTGNDTRSVAMQQANQTAQFLVSKGMEPAMAKTVVSDPVLMRSVLPQMMGIGKSTDDITEYQFAKKEDPTLTFNKFMQQKKAVSGEYSLTPQYGTNDKGETVLVQTGKSGEAIQTKLPAGVKISSGVEKIDLGSSWGLVDKRTGQMVGQQAKDIEGKESAEERGKAKGQAQVNLPNAIAKSEQTLAVIDGMINHPGRETATGLSGTIDPRNYLGGTSAKDFQVRAKQLEGKAFLEAFESLKGGGAISEVEGTKAANAIARLDRSQTDAEYLNALKELRGIIVVGMDRARTRAGQGGQPSSSQPNTDLKKKYGLD